VHHAAAPIVSLAPNVTEIVFALGLGDSLVGVTDVCDYPPQALKIEHVASFGRPNIEKLLSLRPQLVIASGLERKESLMSLESSGIGVLDLQIANIDELMAAVEKVGAATGRQAQASELVDKMNAELQAVAAHTAGQKKKKPKVFVVIEESPLMTAGRQSFLDDVIARAGGVNAAHEITQAYARVNPETVLAWQPDAILLCEASAASHATVDSKAQSLGDRFGWSTLSAIKNRRIIDDINPDLLFRPGPRLVDGVKALAERLER
jgi:iron complex transport system substrate-binding protein